MADICSENNGSALKPEDAHGYSAKDGQWLSAMRSIQSLDETLNDLESNLKSQSSKIPGLVRELINKDKKSVDQSWEGLKSNWTSKCREISSLKKSLNRIIEEKIRLRDENQGLEKSISRLQEQFSQSVKSSLIEIQSLSTANCKLTDEIQRVNDSKRTESSKVRKSVRDIVDKFEDLLPGVTDQKLAKNLGLMKDEVSKIERSLVESSKMPHDIDAQMNLGKTIENSKLETMESHLRELEKELTDKNGRIKELESLNDASLQDGNSLSFDITAEERNWFEYMKKNICQDKVSQIDYLEVFEVSSLTRGLKSAQNLVFDVKDNLADIYKGTISNEDELHDIRTSVDEINIKFRSAQSKLETMEGENEYLKRKLDQEENKLKVSRDEVISLQSRIHMLKQEKDATEIQINNIKGGKEDFKEFCSNLTAENEKMFAEISRVQAERDSVIEQLQDAAKKLAAASQEAESLDGKCNFMEKSLSKLKREYQEQSREMQHYVKENDEMRLLLHEKEASFSETKNEFRNIDIVNKDLEDQVFQISNENQKMQTEITKLKGSKKQLETELKEKRLLIEKIEKSEGLLEEKVRELSKSEKTGVKNSSTLQTELEINEGILDRTLDRVSGLAEIVRQVLKQTKSVVVDFSSDNPNPDLLKDFDSLIKLDLTNEKGNLIELNNQILDLVCKSQNLFLHKFKDLQKSVNDLYSIINRAEIRFQFDAIDNRDESSMQEKLNETKSRLTWILKDYKRLSNVPMRIEDSEKMQTLKDIVLRYIVAATKQLEVIFDNVTGKDCVMMLLPNCKDAEASTQDSNDDLLHYLRETFKANQMALETAVSTLELVKLKGECDVISQDELSQKIMDADQNEICQMMKRMNKIVDCLTEKIQNLMSNADIVRSSSSTSGFDNQEAVTENVSRPNMANLQIKSLTSLADKRGKEIDKLKAEVEFMKMEREHLMSELQEKDFDLGKLEDEIQRLVNSGTGLEDEFSKMKLEYDSISKDLVERENELRNLKEAMLRRDREGDAGELSSTESARSEIERKEGELRRLRSSLEDIRNVHCLNEGRIKTLQNKIEGVTQILSSRDHSIPEEEVVENGPKSHKEQLLVVREIELTTSKAEFCDAEDLKKRVKQERCSRISRDAEISEKLRSKEQENSYLQSVVKELKMELTDVQHGLSQERESKSQLNSLMSARQRVPVRSKFDAAFESEQLRRRNREYDQIRRTYLDDSFERQAKSSDENSLTFPYHSPKHFGYPTAPHDAYAPDCEICAMESVSGASTYICSDEECDCDYASCEMSDTSFASDDEYDRRRMVSPGYHGNYSREARNVSLKEATFVIKSQHRRNRRNTNSPPPMHNPAASPKRSAKRYSMQPNSDSKYPPPQIARSSSARRPKSASPKHEYLERRFSFDNRTSLDGRPLSGSGKYYKREVLHPEESLRSSDECSSISSSSGQCSGSGTEGKHDCKKRTHKMRGKLV